VAILTLAGCTGPAPTPVPTPEPSSSSTSGGTSGSATPSPSADATEPPPELVPDGAAVDNLALFTAVTTAVWASSDRVAGRAYIDALVAAGFDKTAMQVTNDVSTVGNAAESIQFAVRWGEECLIGQVGPATGDPVTTVVPVLAEGSCLVGQTRPIDW
jgi:hypothetical protein